MEILRIYEFERQMNPLTELSTWVGSGGFGEHGHKEANGEIVGIAHLRALSHQNHNEREKCKRNGRSKAMEVGKRELQKDIGELS